MGSDSRSGSFCRQQGENIMSRTAHRGGMYCLEPGESEDRDCQLELMLDHVHWIAAMYLRLWIN